MNAGRIISLFVLVELIIIGASVWAYGFTEPALQSASRYSGRLSLVLFSFIFVTNNKPALLFSWLSNRYYLLFAIVNAFHLAEYLAVLSTSNYQLIPYRLAGGVVAYLFIFSMPVLQYYQEEGKIPVKTFFILETVFLYYIWLVFFLTYLPRVQGKLPFEGTSYFENVGLLGWVSTLLGIKVTSLLQVKRAG